MKGYKDFLNDLGERESNNRYNVENNFGFLGRWQFGKPRLYDAGYSIDGYAPRGLPQKKYLNKVSDFLANKDNIQDRVMNWHVKNLLDTLKVGTFIFKDGDYKVRKKYSSFIGKKVNGITITLSGLVAGAHLKGLGGVQQFLNGTDNADGLGTKISEYISKFGGYQLENEDVIKQSIDYFATLQPRGLDEKRSA